MDILERLSKNIDAAKNGPYISVKEQRDSWQEAAHEIERLRKEVEAMKWRPISEGIVFNLRHIAASTNCAKSILRDGCKEAADKISELEVENKRLRDEVDKWKSRYEYITGCHENNLSDVVDTLRKEVEAANNLLKITHEWLMPLAKNKGYISANDRNNALSVMVDIKMHLEK